jgi:hypothetical protein
MLPPSPIRKKLSLCKTMKACCDVQCGNVFNTEGSILRQLVSVNVTSYILLDSNMSDICAYIYTSILILFPHLCLAIYMKFLLGCWENIKDRTRCRWGNNIRMDLQVIGCKTVNWAYKALCHEVCLFSNC